MSGTIQKDVIIRENNKRIAKNTLLLYFRMIFIMLISLFTIRIVLSTLGVVDYGIYNVVGGIILMFSFLNGTMASASQRYFAFELEKGDLNRLRKTFNLNLSVYLIIGVIFLILSETVGLWFLNNHMTIPANRTLAANWVFQCSIVSFIISMLTVPYNSVIVAHEDMHIYSYVSIVEVTLKLIIVFILYVIKYDKLILYSLLTLFTTATITFIYRTICKKRYAECSFEIIWDSALFKELFSFSGWNIFGALAGTLKNQGINLLLNVFFSPIINAARGIAYNISTVVNSFVINFFKAVQPQITKYYASGNRDEMVKLVFRSSRFSFLLMMILSMPVLLETNFILKLWLNNIPPLTVLFTKLILIQALIESLSYPLMTAAQATGRIKHYQIIVGGVMLLTLPASYILLKFKFPPEVTMYTAIIIAILCLFLRLLLLKKLAGLPFLLYTKMVLFKIIEVTCITYICPCLILSTKQPGTERFILVLTSSLISSFIVTFMMGLTKNEQTYVTTLIRNKLLKKNTLLTKLLHFRNS